MPTLLLVYFEKGQQSMWQGAELWPAATLTLRIDHIFSWNLEFSVLRDYMDAPNSTMPDHGPPETVEVQTGFCCQLDVT